MTDHSTSVREGMKKANSMREEWLNTLSLKETTFKNVVEMSRYEEYRALSTIRILHVLTRSDGWTDRSAIEAMSHYGIGPKDTIRSIRKSKIKIESVDKLLGSDPKMFRPRPVFPDGWPFMGKLSAIYGSMPDVEVPEELINLMSEGDEEAPAHSSQSDDMDDLALLMGGLSEDG